MCKMQCPASHQRATVPLSACRFTKDTGSTPQWAREAPLDFRAAGSYPRALSSPQPLSWRSILPRLSLSQGRSGWSDTSELPSLPCPIQVIGYLPFIDLSSAHVAAVLLLKLQGLSCLELYAYRCKHISEPLLGPGV